MKILFLFENSNSQKCLNLKTRESDNVSTPQFIKLLIISRVVIRGSGPLLKGSGFFLLRN